MKSVNEFPPITIDYGGKLVCWNGYYPWHNPDDLMPDQVEVNKGWRLCLKEESTSFPPAQIWFHKSATWWTFVPTTAFKYFGEGMCTYRTKAPIPEKYRQKASSLEEKYNEIEKIAQDRFNSIVKYQVECESRDKEIAELKKLLAFKEAENYHDVTEILEGSDENHRRASELSKKLIRTEEALKEIAYMQMSNKLMNNDERRIYYIEVIHTMERIARDVLSL